MNRGGTVGAAAGGGIGNQQSGTVDYGFLVPPASVPEPASITMVVLGGLGVVLLSRARRRASTV